MAKFKPVFMRAANAAAEKVCRSKRPFDTKGLALFSADHAGANQGTEAYKCTVCGKYHLTRGEK